MDGIIDADTHVVESDRIWDYFPEHLKARRPVAMVYTEPQTGKARTRWMIDGVVVPKPDGKGGQALQTPPVEAAELEGRSWQTKALWDVPTRLEEADTMGVETQVVFPTLFIAHLTFDAELDVALAQAYNRFMANAYEEGKAASVGSQYRPFMMSRRAFGS